MCVYFVIAHPPRCYLYSSSFSKVLLKEHKSYFEYITSVTSISTTSTMRNRQSHTVSAALFNGLSLERATQIHHGDECLAPDMKTKHDRNNFMC